MDTGHYISGTGHLVFIGWLLFGSVFDADPPPFETTEVSVISGADFDALVAAQQSPDTATDVAQPAQPDVSTDVPEVATTPDDAIEQPTPIQTETPPDDTPPEVTELALPPEAAVDDTPPELDQPIGDVAVLVPEIAPEAVPRPVERVAPEPVAQPEPDATPDPVEQQAVAPDAEGEAIEEPQEAQAPEEATTEIVTEATAAPAASSRPPGRRPAAPEPQVTQTTAPATETPSTPTDTTDAVAAALAEALSGAETPAATAPSGPPLSAGERESLRVAVSGCWNVGSLSSAALQTTVVVSVNMNQNGTPVIETIRQVGASGGSDADAKRVFESARRAIILCGSKGYKLPAEKYSQWQTIEMTFDPRKVGR